MSQLLLSYFYAAVFLFGLIVTIEVLVNFKRPRGLKFFLVTVSASICLRVLSDLLVINGFSLPWPLILPNILLALSGFLYFSTLLNKKPGKIIVSICLSIVAIGLMVIAKAAHLIPVHSINWGINNNPNFIKLPRVIICSTLFGYLLFSFKKINKQFAVDNIYFRAMRFWSNCFVLIVSVLWIANLSRLFVNESNTVPDWIFSIGHLSILLLVLFRPRFLNRVYVRSSFLGAFSKTNQQGFPKDDFIYRFFNRSFYVNANGKLAEFCTELGVSSEELNSFLYKEFNLSFTDLVNKSRVDYFVDLVNKESSAQYTIESLAQKSGFGSRQSLYRSFKKFHGGSPSDLMKMVSPSLMEEASAN